jgi:hypothetical protein
VGEVVVVEEKQEPEKENNGEEVVYFLEALAPTSSTARPASIIEIRQYQPFILLAHDNLPISILRLTRGQALPQLLGLLTILEDQGVQVSGTPDLELGDLLALGSGGLGLFGEDGVGADGGRVEEGLLDLGRCEF